MDSCATEFYRFYATPKGPKMKFVAFMMVFFWFSCAGTKPLPVKPRPMIYESKLALDVFELTKEAEWFPMYERKQIRKMLVEIHKYIMKQITDRIDKHTTGEQID